MWRCAGQVSNVKELKEILATIPDDYEIGFEGQDFVMVDDSDGGAICFTDFDQTDNFN